MADRESLRRAADRRTAGRRVAVPRAHEAATRKEFEQVTEFTEFDRPRRVHVHAVEGPYPVDGTWTSAPDGEGTRVAFAAEGELTGLMKLLEPVARRLLARQFAGYHRNLKQNIERG